MEGENNQVDENKNQMDEKKLQVEEKINKPTDVCEQDRSYTIDKENLREYYKKLDANAIKNDVEMMKVASVKELYELISTNCKHYVSIIENYTEENLQTMFNMTVRRIEGHLLIKFKLNARDRWVEVCFLNDDNTDDETMAELKNVIKYNLKNCDEINNNRRKHLASQLESESNETFQPIIKEGKKALPDNYFAPENNPELKINPQQLQSAGYQPIPDDLKGVLSQLRKPETKPLNLSDFNKKIPPSSLKIERETSPVIDDFLGEFKNNVRQQVKDKITNGKKKRKLNKHEQKVLDNIHQQHQLMEMLNQLTQMLQTTPKEYHLYVYQTLLELVKRQDVNVLTTILIELIIKNQIIDNLNDNQKQIVKKYDVNLMDLFK